MLVRMMIMLKYDNLDDDNDSATTCVAPAVYTHMHILMHSRIP